jgi:streptogramin lyase
MLLVAGCQTTGNRPTAQPSVPTESRWQQVDLPQMPQGTRKAVYDASRDCIWIVSQVPAQIAGAQEYVTITRMDASTRVLTQTDLQLHPVQFYIARVALDSSYRLWMAWDRTLVRYDPSTNTVESFALPSFASLGVHVSLYSGEGNFVAVTVDSKGEVWVAADKVAAVFGFNSTTHRWDRLIHLPWFPSDETTLAEPRPGLLTVNGYRSPDGKAYYNTFARIDTATGRLTQIAQPVSDYFVINDHEALFLGQNRAPLFKLDIDTGAATRLASDLPVDSHNGRAQFALSRDGHLWFGMLGYRTFGLGDLDMTSAAVNTFPFPYIDQPGKHLPNDCPPMQFHCVPSSAVGVADIEAVIVDAHQNVWVVTDWPNVNDQNNRGPMGPIVELKAVS